MKNANMRVVMGSSAIKAFVAAPKSLKILGIVRMGLEFGLLGQDAEGRYLRVNGSQIERLNRSEVLAAIEFALDSGRRPINQDVHAHQVVSKPVVAIRKRRHVLPALLNGPALLAA
ncbi:MAG: hypothetical protein WCK56_13535 [Alcaligenaceae bacterium]